MELSTQLNFLKLFPPYILVVNSRQFMLLFRMEVNFTGFPTPVIHWYREGVEIQPSRDFQISHLYQKSFLVIPEVFLEDAGKFTVRAVSQFGMAECNAPLSVQGVFYPFGLQYSRSFPQPKLVLSYNL